MSTMSPALMAAFKKRMSAKKSPMMPKVTPVAAPPMDEEMDPAEQEPDSDVDDEGMTPTLHHAQVQRHLNLGLNGSRRAAKVHLKMALYHHSMAIKGKK